MQDEPTFRAVRKLVVYLTLTFAFNVISAI